MNECPACHQKVSRLDAPPQSDTGAWRELSREHAPDCAWVRTHAPADQSMAAAVAQGDVAATSVQSGGAGGGPTAR